MNKELATVVSAEQGKVIDHAKVYYEATISKGNEFLGYAYLCGKALLALKDITPHGQFGELKESLWPEKARQTLDRYMLFTQATDSKKLTVSILKDESFLLADKELPKTVQEEVFDAVLKSTKGKGMMETIHEWKKKNAPKPAPLNEVEKEQADRKNIEAIYETCYAACLRVLQLKKADKALLPRATRDKLSALWVRCNKDNAGLNKARD